MFKHPTVGLVKMNYGILACIVVLGMSLMICWICFALNWNIDYVEMLDVGIALVVTMDYFPLLDV